jgi:hypothetical protein
MTRRGSIVVPSLTLNVDSVFPGPFYSIFRADFSARRVVARGNVVRNQTRREIEEHEPQHFFLRREVGRVTAGREGEADDGFVAAVEAGRDVDVAVHDAAVVGRRDGIRRSPLARPAGTRRGVCQLRNLPVAPENPLAQPLTS